MVKPNFGYTLVEMMIVLGIVAFLSTMALFANRSFAHGQAVKKEQQKFLAELRSVQAGVNSGVDGVPFGVVRVKSNNGRFVYEIGSKFETDEYTEWKATEMPEEISIDLGNSPVGAPVYICFANQNFLATHPEGFSNDLRCGNRDCYEGGGDYFACADGERVGVGGASGELTFTFKHTQSDYSPSVVIAGKGIDVTRMYETQ